jgi:hypothetical protein
MTLRTLEVPSLGATILDLYTVRPTPSSQSRWRGNTEDVYGPKQVRAILFPWPVDRPADWTEHVNAALTGKEIERLEVSERRGPYGGDAWVADIVARLGMEHTVRPEGRPGKDDNDRQPASAAKATNGK